MRVAVGHFSTGGQKYLKTKNLMISLKMAKTQRGIHLAEIKNFMARKKMISLCLDSILGGNYRIFSDAFLFQSGHLYDVVSLKIEKLMIANFES